jgi:hypothetical protein
VSFREERSIFLSLDVMHVRGLAVKSRA